MGFWCIFFKTSGRIHILMKVVVLSHSPSCIKKANVNHHVSACSKILFFHHNFERYKLKIQNLVFFYGFVQVFMVLFLVKKCIYKSVVVSKLHFER
jgi:hypothetical protein